MGWFDSIFGARSADPLKDLDPKIREFLEKESPVQLPPPTPPTPPSKSEPSQTPRQGLAAPTAPAAVDDKPKVPAASLFPDGRYAHIWKTYRPLWEIETENKSDNERLMDVLEGYKARKRAIGEAALENCVVQQQEWRDCIENGWLGDQLKMCRVQMRAFERCYMTQARLLKALGYHSSWDRSPEVEEDIQMHADALYSRLVAHEEAVKLAKVENREPPAFDPQLPDAKARMAVEPSEALLKQWKEQMDVEQVPDSERPLYEAALRADLQANARTKESVETLWKNKTRERNTRIEEGKAGITDHFAAVLQWNKDADLGGKGDGRKEGTADKK